MRLYFAAHPLAWTYLHAAILGFTGAAGADFKVLHATQNQGWKGLLAFDWNVATYRWFWGIIGAVGVTLGAQLGMAGLTELFS